MTGQEWSKTDNKRLQFVEAREERTTLKSRPSVFWLDLTGRCNLKCSHCAFNVHGRTSQSDIREDVYQRVLSELMPTASVCNLGGTNYGEMTISKNFHRFLLDCRNFGVAVNLTTNGTKLSEKWLDDLVDVAVVVGLSLEGMEKQFEIVRGFSWHHFLKNCESLLRRRSQRRASFKIEWRYCAHSDNVEQLPRMIALAKSIGIDRIQVMNLIPFVPAQRFKNLYYHRSLANRCFAEARRLAADVRFDISIPDDFDVGTFARAKCALDKTGVEAATVRMPSCYRPWSHVAINELGDVRPCCVYWRSVGNIADTHFENVWNSSRYRRLRGRVNRAPDSICRSCRMPAFDSEAGLSLSQLAPGVRQLARAVLGSIRPRRDITFTDSNDPAFDPASAAGGPG